MIFFTYSIRQPRGIVGKPIKENLSTILSKKYLNFFFTFPSHVSLMNKTGNPKNGIMICTLALTIFGEIHCCPGSNSHKSLFSFASPEIEFFFQMLHYKCKNNSNLPFVIKEIMELVL